MKETGKKIGSIAKKRSLLSSKPIAHGVGRRKSSIARVWLRHGTGKITVNTKNIATYFHTEVSQRAVLEPLAIVSAGSIFDIDINVKGGGIHSQADASKLGISRALIEFDDQYKLTLKLAGFLTVDARRKERKKPGQPGARRKFQFVKR